MDANKAVIPSQLMRGVKNFSHNFLIKGNDLIRKNVLGERDKS